MPLEHSIPPTALAVELEEVATDAQELIDVLHHGLNAPLPADFPKDQLIDICATLVRLPNGTAEGCRSPLEYARKRLPAIRGDHISTNRKPASDGSPILVRGERLDQKLAILISAVSTALDAYGKLASDQQGLDFEPEAGVHATSSVIEDVVSQARDLDAGLQGARKTVDELTQPSSARADSLKRQLQDAQGLGQLTSAEVRMPRVVPGWLRGTVRALKNYPDLIRRTAMSLQTGADVAEIWVERWHEFSHEGVKFLFEQFRKTTRAAERTADTLERTQDLRTKATAEEQEPTLDEERGVTRAIKKRMQLQSEVRKTVDALETIEKDIRDHQHTGDLEPLSVTSSVAHAREYRTRLQTQLVKGLQELASIERYLIAHRQFTLTPMDRAPTTAATDPTLGVVGPGYTQRIFQLLALTVLRELGRPMQSGELVEAFAYRGHALGGTNPTRTAWNRLWEAKANGVLVNLPGRGYWISGEPLPIEALVANSVGNEIGRKRKYRGSGRSARKERGRKKILSDTDMQTATRWLSSGKSLDEVCADLGGISRATIYNYFPGGAQALREQFPTVFRKSETKPYRRRPGVKPTGRKPTLSPEQIAESKTMHASGSSVAEISEVMGVSARTIYSVIGGIRRKK